MRELERTFTDPYFVKRLPSEEAEAFLALLRSDAIMTKLTVDVRGVATHPEDDLVLSTALSGDASVLCTRDKQLLKLRAYRSVAILSPGELLARIAGETVE